MLAPWFAALVPPGATVVAAVSGGADSVALADLLVSAGRWRVILWHLDHGLRADAAADAELVTALAARWRVPCRCERADVPALVRGDGIEEAARRARYARLAHACRQLGATIACTAHHRDDQAETVLLQILRGSGPPAGIAPTRSLAPGLALVRPLLHATRDQLRQHGIDRGLPWREDSTNADQRIRRNHLRHAVLPAWEAGCPGIGAALADLADRAQRQREADRQAVAGIVLDGRLDVQQLRSLPPAQRTALWLRLCQRLGIEPDRHRLHRLADLAAGAPGRRLRLGPWLLCQRRGGIDWMWNDPQG